MIHPDRYGATKRGPNRLICLHTSEGGEGLNSAEQLVAFMTRPGDRPLPGGGTFGSSYSYVVDTDRIIPCVPENVVSYSAAGANNDGIHICFPGRARQSRQEWLDSISSAYINQCADLMVNISRRTGIPLRRLTALEVRAGMSGYCDHWTITEAYGRTHHTDVGPQFPWDVLESRFPKQPPSPTPLEGDMFMVKQTTDPAIWVVYQVGAQQYRVHITEAQYGVLKARCGDFKTVVNVAEFGMVVG